MGNARFLYANLATALNLTASSERTGIVGCERELVLAYLLHMVEVIKPSEGLAPMRELLHALAAR